MRRYIVRVKLDRRCDQMVTETRSVAVDLFRLCREVR